MSRLVKNRTCEDCGARVVQLRSSYLTHTIGTPTYRDRETHKCPKWACRKCGSVNTNRASQLDLGIMRSRALVVCDDCRHRDYRHPMIVKLNRMRAEYARGT